MANPAYMPSPTDAYGMPLPADPTPPSAAPGASGVMPAAPPPTASMGDLNPNIPGGVPTTMPTPPAAPPPQQPTNQDIGIPPPFVGQPAQRGGAVKNALTRMMYGFAQAGMKAAGLPDDYDIYKANLERSIQANDLALKQQAQQFGQQMVDTPMGPMPQQTWQKIGGSFLAAQARMQGADITGQYGLQKQEIASRFKETPNGLYDTQTKMLMPGTANGTMVDPPLVAKYPFLAPLLGTHITAGNVLTANQQQISAAPTITTQSDQLGPVSTTVKTKSLPGTAAPAAAGGVATPTGAAAPLRTSGGASPGTPRQQAQSGITDLIGTYRMNPTVMTRLLTKHPELLGQIQSKYPNFDQTMYNAKNKVVSDYFAGPEGRQIDASNTALAHLGTLNDAVQALGNGDLKALNGLAVGLKLQTGNSAPAVYKTIVNRVAPELAKAYVATGGTGTERGADAADFDPSLAPQQLYGNISMSAQLLRSKLNSMENKWSMLPGGVGADIPFSRFISPEAQRTLNRFGGQQGAAPQASGRPITQAAPTPTSHVFDSAAWLKTHPGGNVDAAKAYAKTQGYTVK